MRRRKLILAVVLGSFGVSVHAQIKWIEDTFEDFTDGTLDASGQNLYVSRDGRIRTIHRFDLNQDGYIDLIFNSTHDTRTFIPATLGCFDAAGRLQSADLPVQGSTQVVLADLNRDGWLDVVFCPNDSGIQHRRRYLTVLWGSAEGWTSRRSGAFLPAHDASAIAVPDLNADGWPDIAVLNGEAWLPGQPAGHIVRVYLGGEDGYVIDRYREFGVPAASSMVAGDLDRDGAADLAVLVTSGRLEFLWATKAGPTDEPFARSELSLPTGEATCLAQADVNDDGELDLIVGTSQDKLIVLEGRAGRDWEPPREMPAFPASHLTAGDLDGDNRIDLVVANFNLARAGGGEAAGAKGVEENVRILWGDVAGFSAARSTEWPAPYATATAIGDMDGDGTNDLLVAVHQTAQTFAATSLLLRGRGNRRFERVPGGFATEGAMDVAYAPPQRPLLARAVFANSLGGTVGENVPLLVYWGGADGFDASRRLEIPFRSGDEASAGDFNADGFVDLLAVNSQHAGAAAAADPHAGANIFWGSAEGFDFQHRRTVLREAFLGTSNTADLDRDGYLDLVLGIFDPIEPDGPTPVVIYHGSAEGFSASRRTVLPCEGRSIGTLIADFDRNGWLDIAVSSTYLGIIRVFWADAAGFDPARQTRLNVPFPIDLETADLNGDGHLDLIAGSYYDPVTHHHDTGTVIFWGNADGFRPWDAQRLPGKAPVGHCVADFDGDGFLDIFAPHYLGELTREQIPSYLFWGGPQGFGPERRTMLICDSAHDALAADFDRDGRLDLAVSCHSRDGSHHTNSKVFHNDGQRFTRPRVVELPTHGTHWMWEQDLGHIYDRTWRQTYESSVFSYTAAASAGRLTYDADVPAAASLEFHVRSGSNEAQLAERAWTRVDGEVFSLSPADRALQYRVVFASGNGDSFAVLDRVEIELSN